MKRIVSVLLMLCLLAALLPQLLVAAAEPDNGNGGDAQPVEWTYQPPAESAASETREAIPSSDIVSVLVTAKDAATGKTVTVENAKVCLYVGDKLLRQAITSADGIGKLTLSGLSIEERKAATISAYKSVYEGTGLSDLPADPDDPVRSTLFRYYGTADDYSRYSIELHSDTIDANGNWCGEALPASYESNKVDVVFAVDATGSMRDEINNVRDNIAAFTDSLLRQGLDVRFCIIDYRDITCDEPTIIHTVNGSHWYTSLEVVADLLSNIDVDGGGDNDETPLDALGMVADNALMQWRSDAYKFTFVLTDAGYKVNNNYGYTSLQSVSNALLDAGVSVSVITSSQYFNTYKTLYTTTGGISANIYGDFKEQMLSLADSIASSTIRSLCLALSEPRMLVKLSACYLADNAASKSDAYKAGVKNMLNEYANRIAETTDGHVLIDKILLFSTDNRLDFYDTDKLPSMADIRIETREDETRSVFYDGEYHSTTDAVQVHSNAFIAGFWKNTTYTAAPFSVDNDGKYTYEHFQNLSEDVLRQMDGLESFYRIQLSGTEGAGWNNSMLDDAYAYSTTVAHETGHYLFGLLDEYLAANKALWSDESYPRPYDNFGLMDGQHYDIELSKAGIDYAYLGDFDTAGKNLHSFHSWVYRESCEDSLADLLTSKSNFAELSKIFSFTPVNKPIGPYAATYSKASLRDRTATYSYAALSAADYLSLPDSALRAGAARSVPDLDSMVKCSINLADIAVTCPDNQLTLTLTAKPEHSYEVYYRLSGGAYAQASGSGSVFTLPIGKDSTAQVLVVARTDDRVFYNEYYVDRTGEIDRGYYYTSADSCTNAYVLTDTSAEFLFIAENKTFENGEYRSVNQATLLNSSDTASNVCGEIFSAAKAGAEIDYSSLSWFVYRDNVWNKLPTDLSEEEDLNIGARANLDGDGLYVLMAKSASGTAKPVTELRYTQSTDVDALVTLSFDDPNDSSKYYVLYYSEKPITDLDGENVIRRVYQAKEASLQLNLLTRQRRVYAAIAVILENGSQSALSDTLIISGTADSDGDGIPDWYCDKYKLWGEDGKDIANSDDDGDGLSNYDEYLGGSDPTDPNDPEHTTNIAVTAISVVESCTLKIGSTRLLTATVTPANATNRAVTWFSSNPEIATVDAAGLVTGISKGVAMVTVTSADGGFAARCRVVVSETEMLFTDIPEDTYYTEAVYWAVANNIMVGISDTVFSPDASMSRAMIVTILYRLDGTPTVTKSSIFSDVRDDDWYADAVSWAASKKIASGYGNGKFGPNDRITREQMAALLYRFARYLGYDTAARASLQRFPDVDSMSAWAQEPLMWAVAEGAISGAGTNGAVYLRPKNDATRAQVATIFMRYSTSIVSSISAEPPASKYTYVLDNCSWRSAQAAAVAAGGHLACFESMAEYRYVLAELSRQGFADVFFRIGGRRDSDSLSYYWANEKDVLYGESLNAAGAWCVPLWNDGKPSYFGGGVDREYLQMYYSSFDGCWIWEDTGNYMTYPTDPARCGYIIEFEPAS